MANQGNAASARDRSQPPPWFLLAMQQFAQEHIDPRFRSMDEKLDNIEGKLGEIEDKLEEVEGGISNLDEKIESLDTSLEEVDGKADSIDGTVGDMDDKLDGLDARFDGADERLEAIDEVLENIDKRLVQAQITGTLAYNSQCADGELRAFREVPFPDGELPSETLPAITSVRAMANLTDGELDAYYLRYCHAAANIFLARNHKIDAVLKAIGYRR
ncbi:hypothetical protein BOTBODRAFT_171164 [Botryobasidium botryosum FD-172 SS1]|uniref:Mug135-like C-terminal domain-containing protein n=1 Tax=Botryobasidium botryosum (strain FD-172 SS1) TaxID=930990 RepID=A0A067N2E4_BOTB1|nr:hypothetical protein BOTBODRAFT_171164 [Botryobasidium botryosum FD-172 SS1]